jgi:Chaperone of endosialidase
MNSIRVLMGVGFSLMCSITLLLAQQTMTTANTVVPSLVSFTGMLTDVNGKPLSGVVGVTFCLYQEQQGGAPLWMETQNVQPDKYGNYSVMLGSTTSQGLPTSLFVSGEARWLGVQAQGQAEQPRVMLLAVPYALKAGDAQTIGGLPASAFALAGTSIPGTSGSSGHGTASSNVAKNGAQTVAGGGTTGYLAEWTSATNLGNSLFFQSSAGNLGISTTAPSQKFEVDLGNLLARGANNFTKSGNTAFLYVGDTNHLVEASYGGGLTLGAYKAPQALFIADNTGYVGIGSSAPAQKFEVDLGNLLARGSDNFQKSGDTAYLYVGDTNHPIEAIYDGGLALGAYKWPQAVYIQDNTGNVGIGTASPSSSLEVNGTSKFDGLMTFAAGQTFPGVPQLNTANTFTGNQTVNGTLTATGAVSASSFQIGNFLFAYGSYSASNTLLGFAGNPTMTGTANTATGMQALFHDTTGNINTVYGNQAMYYNTTGHHNTANGNSALYGNSTGAWNTAVGDDALGGNSTGNSNTAAGLNALAGNDTGSDNTSVGDDALSSNRTGSDNTAVGFLSGDPLDSSSVANDYNTFLGSGAAPSTGTLTNATAIGAKAVVGESNALVLGSINGLNNAAASTNVGIGTTIPAAVLSVSGVESTADGTGAAIEVSNTAAGGANWYLKAGATGTNTPAGGVSIGSDGLYAMAINSSGQVGIGTLTPANTLEVVAGGTTLADAWTTRSSRRWKTNIHTLPDALAKIEQLRGVTYDLKANGKHEVGVIAEEVGAVVPELVTYEDNGKDARGVDYGRLTALLIEATKEQQKLIRKQQQQIRIQLAQIQRLSSQVRAIQASLDANDQLRRDVRTAKAQVPVVDR